MVYDMIDDILDMGSMPGYMPDIVPTAPGIITVKTEYESQLNDVSDKHNMNIQGLVQYQ